MFGRRIPADTNTTLPSLVAPPPNRSKVQGTSERPPEMVPTWLLPWLFPLILVLIVVLVGVAPGYVSVALGLIAAVALCAVALRFGLGRDYYDRLRNDRFLNSRYDDDLTRNDRSDRDRSRDSRQR